MPITTLIAAEARLDSLTAAVLSDGLEGQTEAAAGARVSAEALEDAWLASDVYTAFEQLFEELQSQPARRPHLKSQWLSEAELDEWIQRALSQADQIPWTSVSVLCAVQGIY